MIHKSKLDATWVGSMTGLLISAVICYAIGLPIGGSIFMATGITVYYAIVRFLNN